MKLRFLNWQLYFSWLGLSIYLLLMIVLCSLGFWQLDRSAQKSQYLAQQQNALAAANIDLNQQQIIELESVRYQKVTAKGHYDKTQQFLLDNQILEGKSGYFVLTPFFPDGQHQAVLVNRGWIGLGNDRRQLPTVDLKSEPIQISGRINAFPSVGIKLKGAEIPTDTWPAVVQVIDPAVLSKKLGYELASYQIQLEPEAAEGYRREWKINTVITPEKHLGYAVQWFGLALTLTVLFIWISNKKRSEYTA